MQEADGYKSVICPGCNSEIVPIVDYEYGLAPKIMACLLCPLCSCCLPFLIPEFKTPHYYCPNCNSQITEFDQKFGRKQSTEKSKSPKTITFEILNINVLQKLPERVRTQDDIKLRKASSEEYIENKPKSFRGRRSEKNFSDTYLKLENSHKKDLDTALLSKSPYQTQFDENVPPCFCHMSHFCKCNRPKPYGDLNKNGSEPEMNACSCYMKNENPTIFYKSKNNNSETNANVTPKTVATFEVITKPKKRGKSKSKTKIKPKKIKSTVELNIVPQQSVTKKCENFDISVRSGTSVSTSSPSITSVASGRRRSRCSCKKNKALTQSAVVEKCKKCVKTPSRYTITAKKTIYNNKSSLNRRIQKRSSINLSKRMQKKSSILSTPSSRYADLACKCKDKQTSYHQSPNQDKTGLLMVRSETSVTGINNMPLGHAENTPLRSKIPVDTTRRNQMAILNDLLKLLEQNTNSKANHEPSTPNINVTPIISLSTHHRKSRKTSSGSSLSEVEIKPKSSSVEKNQIDESTLESNIHKTKTAHNRWGLKTRCSCKTLKTKQEHILCPHKSRKLLHHSKKSKKPKTDKSKESLPNIQSCECKDPSKEIETIFSKTSVSSSENKRKPTKTHSGERKKQDISRKNSKSKHDQSKSKTICACKTESKTSRIFRKSSKSKTKKSKSKTICACKIEPEKDYKNSSKAFRSKICAYNAKIETPDSSSQSLVQNHHKNADKQKKTGSRRQETASVISICSSQSEQMVNKAHKSKDKKKQKTCTCKPKEQEKPSKVSINVSHSTESIVRDTESIRSITNKTQTIVEEIHHKKPREEKPSEVSFSDTRLGKNYLIKCKCKNKKETTHMCVDFKRKKPKTHSDTIITEDCKFKNPKKKSKTQVAACSSENIQVVLEKCEPKRKKKHGKEKPYLIHTEVSQISICSVDSGQMPSTKTKLWKKKKDKTTSVLCKCPSGKLQIKTAKPKTSKTTFPKKTLKQEPTHTTSVTIVNETTQLSTTSLYSVPCEDRPSLKKMKVSKKKTKKSKDPEEPHSCMIKSIKKCIPVSDFRTTMSNDSLHNSNSSFKKQHKSGIPISMCVKTSPVSSMYNSPVGSSEMRSKIPRSNLCSHCEQYETAQSEHVQESLHRKTHSDKKRFGKSKSKKHSQIDVSPKASENSVHSRHAPEGDLGSAHREELNRCCCSLKTSAMEHSHHPKKSHHKCRQQMVTQCACPKKAIKCGTSGHCCPNRSRVISPNAKASEISFHARHVSERDIHLEGSVHQEENHCLCSHKPSISKSSEKNKHSRHPEKPSDYKCGQQVITQCACPKKTLKCGTDGHTCPNRGRPPKTKKKSSRHRSQSNKRESTSYSSTSATSTSESCQTCKKVRIYPCVEKERLSEMHPQRNAKTNTQKIYVFVDNAENVHKFGKRRSAYDITPRKKNNAESPIYYYDDETENVSKPMYSCKMVTQETSIDNSSSQISFSEEEIETKRKYSRGLPPPTSSSLSQSSRPSDIMHEPVYICNFTKKPPASPKRKKIRNSRNYSSAHIESPGAASKRNCKYCRNHLLIAEARALFTKPKRKSCKCCRNFSPVYSEPTSACKICRNVSPVNSSEMMISQVSLDSHSTTPTPSITRKKTMKSKIPVLVCRRTSPVSFNTEEKRPLSRKESGSNNMKQRFNSSSSFVSYGITPRNNNFALNRHEQCYRSDLKSNLHTAQTSSSVISSCEKIPMSRSSFALNQHKQNCQTESPNTSHTFQTAGTLIYNCATCHSRYPKQYVSPNDSLEHIRRTHGTRCQVCGHKSIHCICPKNTERFNSARRNRHTNTFFECKHSTYEPCPKKHTVFMGCQTSNSDIQNHRYCEQEVLCCRSSTHTKKHFSKRGANKKRQEFICERSTIHRSPCQSQTSQISVSSTSSHLQLRCQNCNETINSSYHPKRTTNDVGLNLSRGHNKNKWKKSLSFKPQKSSLLICTMSQEQHIDNKPKKRKKIRKGSSRKASKVSFSSSMSSSHSDSAMGKKPCAPKQIICVNTETKKPKKKFRKAKKGSKALLSSTESESAVSLIDICNSSTVSHVVEQYQTPESFVCYPHKHKKKMKATTKGMRLVITPVCAQDSACPEMPIYAINNDIKSTPVSLCNIVSVPKTSVEPSKISFFKRLIRKLKPEPKQYFICQVNDAINAKKSPHSSCEFTISCSGSETVFEKAHAKKEKKAMEKKIHKRFHVDPEESPNFFLHEKKNKPSRVAKYTIGPKISCCCHVENPYESECQHQRANKFTLKRKGKTARKTPTCCCADSYESEDFSEHHRNTCCRRHNHYPEHSGSFTQCKCSKPHRSKTPAACSCRRKKVCTCPSKRKSRSSNERVICCRKCSYSHHKSKRKKRSHKSCKC